MDEVLEVLAVVVKIEEEWREEGKRDVGTGRTQIRSRSRLCCSRALVCARVGREGRTRSRSSSIRRRMSLREKLEKVEDSGSLEWRLWRGVSCWEGAGDGAAYEVLRPSRSARMASRTSESSNRRVFHDRRTC